jgi:hypothetical protein
MAFEGRLSRESLGESLSRGQSSAGDLIPWTLSQQFSDDAFGQLAGARFRTPLMTLNLPPTLFLRALHLARARVEIKGTFPWRDDIVQRDEE